MSTGLNKKYSLSITPLELRDGLGWMPHFSVMQHHGPYSDDTPYWGTRACQTKEEAIEASRALVEREISKREGRRVVLRPKALQ